jgi:hypothetical protein
MTFKIILYGFVSDSDSYIKDSWCQLDFFIVATSILDMSLTNLNLSFLKVFILI